MTTETNNDTQLIEVAAIDDKKELTYYFAEKYGIPQGQVQNAILTQCFPKDEKASIVDVMVFLAIAKQYDLNPFLKEIYAFKGKKGGQIVPIVGFDGYISLMTRHPAFKSIDVKYADKTTTFEGKEVPEYCEAQITLKNGATGPVIREYFDEVSKPGKDKWENITPWGSHPRRMLRHKTVIQCARATLGFSGIYDPDEADSIVMNMIEEPKAPAWEAPKLIQDNPIDAKPEEDGADGDLRAKDATTN